MADILLKIPIPRPSNLSTTSRAFLKSVKVFTLFALALLPLIW
ncbi:hypothetical protein [Clostridium botulinum]|nr:hypothetical protein [Clostridium botulinum]